MLYLKTAFKDMSENSVLVPALELGIVKPLIAFSLLRAQRKSYFSITLILTGNFKNIAASVLSKTRQFYIISRI
jgi:hypothetical protein